MDIKTCKKCQFYSLDTLTDGTKENYCYPLFPYLTAPCKNRKKSQCNEIKRFRKSWKPIDLVKEIGEQGGKIEIASVDLDWKNNAVYLEDD